MYKMFQGATMLLVIVVIRFDSYLLYGTFFILQAIME